MTTQQNKMNDPILLVRNEQELNDLLYEEKMLDTICLASKGITWAKRKVVAELGETEFDNLPEYDSGAERGSSYE